jgi:hypothetical protein
LIPCAPAKPQKWSSSLASNSALAKFFFQICRRAAYLLYYREEKNRPYTLLTHARTIHEKVGNTLQHNYSKNTFSDQTARQRLIQKLPSYPVREHEVS